MLQETPIYESLAAEMEARRRLAELHDDDPDGLEDLGDYIREYATARGSESGEVEGFLGERHS